MPKVTQLKVAASNKKRYPRLPKRRRSWAAWGLFVVVACMSATILAILFLGRQAEKSSLDSRSGAMVDSGAAELNTYPFDQSTVKVGQEQQIQLQINTKGKSVDAIELRFEIIADQGLLESGDITFSDNPPAGLEVNKAEILSSSCNKDCYTATLIVTSEDSQQPFSSHDQYLTIAKLNFTPQAEGNLQLKISQDSQVLDHQSNRDILDKPSVLDFQYYVTANGIDPAQCRYQYSDWSSCQNNWQTRDYTVEPSGCRWYQSGRLEELSRSCNSGQENIISANPNLFYIYPLKNCWYAADDGSGVYIIWDSSRYQNVSWIDVSTDPNFADYYHKQVEGNIDQSSGNFRMVTGKNFSHAFGGSGSLAFETDKQYYFRLYTQDGKHIISARFYMSTCSGADKLYRSCNESCGAQSDDPNKICAAGLSCVAGQCRRETNPDDSLCLPVSSDGRNLSLSSSCNQYCADSSECGAGLTCSWNRCRLPSNPGSASCQTAAAGSGQTTTQSSAVSGSTAAQNRSIRNVLLPSEAYDLRTYACNQGCNNNRDCDSNLRCYQGQCRLAEDPENVSCGGSSVISAPPADEKGAVVELASDEASLDGQPSTAVTGSSREATIQVTPVVLEGEQVSTIAPTENWLSKILNNFNWQWLAIAGALFIVALVLIVLGIARSRQNIWQQPQINISEDNSAFEPKTVEEKNPQPPAAMPMPQQPAPEEPQTPPQLTAQPKTEADNLETKEPSQPG